VNLETKEIAKPQVGISQLCLRVEQFRPFVSQGHFSALDVQVSNDAGTKILLLAFEFLLENVH
jgi:hypothetical protein